MASEGKCVAELLSKKEVKAKRYWTRIDHATKSQWFDRLNLATWSQVLDQESLQQTSPEKCSQGRQTRLSVVCVARLSIQSKTALVEEMDNAVDDRPSIVVVVAERREKEGKWGSIEERDAFVYEILLYR
jgi:hypothetical protein